MEMVDVLTADGNKTTASISRNEAHSKGLWHRTVHVWIKNGRGDLLLQKRSSTKETHPGLWDISCAGHLSAGDSSIEAALREMQEELGISCENNTLKFLFTLSQQYASPDHLITDNEITDVFLLTKPIEEHAVSPDPKEVAEVAVFNVNELKKKLVTKKEIFVPHEEEYRRLFRVLDEGAIIRLD
jgi:isopentenyl-diphosphate Delta-isomerase